MRRSAAADGHRPPLVLKRGCPKGFAFTKQQSYYNNVKPKNQVEKQNLYKSVCWRRDVGIAPYAQGRSFCVGRGALSEVVGGEGGLRMRRILPMRSVLSLLRPKFVGLTNVPVYRSATIRSEISAPLLAPIFSEAAQEQRIAPCLLQVWSVPSFLRPKFAGLTNVSVYRSAAIRSGISSTAFGSHILRSRARAADSAVPLAGAVGTVVSADEICGTYKRSCLPVSGNTVGNIRTAFGSHILRSRARAADSAVPLTDAVGTVVFAAEICGACKRSRLPVSGNTIGKIRAAFGSHILRSRARAADSAVPGRSGRKPNTERLES